MKKKTKDRCKGCNLYSVTYCSECKRLRKK